MAIGSSSSSSAPSLPPLTPALQSLSACRFSSWYPPLRKVSPKATILDVSSLQPDFFQWLEEDGLVLPRGSGAGVVGGENQNDQQSLGDGDDESDDDEEDFLIARDFSPLDERIRQVIEKYNGEVFPKLDWSAPRDAAWILPGKTLQCTTPADVYLLLKSSDFVAKDLTQLEELKAGPSSEATSSTTAKEEEEITLEQATLSLSIAPLAPSSHSNLTASLRLNLILKRHFAVAPAHEFRCFVRAGQFVGIAQRDGNYYDFLQPEETRTTIRLQLLDFWQANLKDRIPVDRGSSAAPESQESSTLQDYVWDAYFTRDRSRVFLMDVNPYLPRTDALLWDWDELEARAEKSWRRQHGADATAPSGVASNGNHAASNGAAQDEEEEEDSADEFTGESSSEDDEPDPRGEPFIRIYTDGRPPTTHYRPYSPTSNPPQLSRSNGNHPASPRPPHRIPPPHCASSPLKPNPKEELQRDTLGIAVI